MEDNKKEMEDKEKDKKQMEDMLKNAGKDFSIFITGLSMQALISLGDLEHPVNKKKEKDLNQAKYMIDTLDMIKEKTKGNLESNEEKFLEDTLYNLRMKYLELVKMEEK